MYEGWEVEMTRASHSGSQQKEHQTWQKILSFLGTPSLNCSC